MGRGDRGGLWRHRAFRSFLVRRHCRRGKLDRFRRGRSVDRIVDYEQHGDDGKRNDDRDDRRRRKQSRG
jgi:hypothetical protein